MADVSFKNEKKFGGYFHHKFNAFYHHHNFMPHSKVYWYIFFLSSRTFHLLATTVWQRRWWWRYTLDQAKRSSIIPLPSHCIKQHMQSQFCIEICKTHLFCVPLKTSAQSWARSLFGVPARARRNQPKRQKRQQKEWNEKTRTREHIYNPWHLRERCSAKIDVHFLCKFSRSFFLRLLLYFALRQSTLNWIFHWDVYCQKFRN